MHTVGVLTARNFRAAVMDQLLVDDRDFCHTARAFHAAVNFNSFE